MNDGPYKLDGGIEEIHDWERVQDLLDAVERAQSAVFTRVEIYPMGNGDVRSPRIIVTAGRGRERDICKDLAPVIADAINQTFGQLLLAMAAAAKEGK